MCKEVCEVYFVYSKGQHEDRQKTVRVVDILVPYVWEKDILQRSYKYQSASASDCRDSWHATAATESILSTFCLIPDG